MRVLALDTTTRAGSAALVADDRVVDERSGDGARTHALRLPGEIVALAEANQWPLSTIDRYAVASGPGSFTGLRIGIATIQGLAFVQAGAWSRCRRSSAGARGEQWSSGRRGDAAWMDAHRRRVHGALSRHVRPALQPGAPDRARRADGRHARNHARAMAHAIGGEAVVAIGDSATLYAATSPRCRPRSASCLIHNLPARLVFWRSTEAGRPSIPPRCVRSTCAAMSKS
jgi:tRNA threonylcarbamoyl adenosine modification protein YeaZ